MGLRHEPGLAGDFGLVVLWVAGSSRMWLDRDRGLKGFLLLVVEAHLHGLFPPSCSALIWASRSSGSTYW